MADTPASPLVAPPTPNLGEPSSTLGGEPLTRAEIAAAEARCAQLKMLNNMFGDMEIIIVPDPMRCEREVHFIAHDGCCIRCGGGHAVAIQHAGPAGTFTDLPRALVGNAAYLALVERIEDTVSAVESILTSLRYAAPEVQDFHHERIREAVRALLSPPKEPTRC